MTAIDISSKPISSYLRELIDKAKQSVKIAYEHTITAQRHTRTAKEDILSVYYQAIKEGFGIRQARKLVEQEITTVSPRYIREILPEESKRSYKSIASELVPNQSINTTSKPNDDQLAITQEDIDIINQHKDDDEDDDLDINQPGLTIQEKIEKQTIENIQLEQELKEAKKQIQELQSPKQLFHGWQDEIDKEEKERPVKSYTLYEYEEEHPTIAESPFQAIGEINRSIARLWTALTKQKNMPTREDDVKKDYVIPARLRLQDIANGSNKVERDFMFNWLTWLMIAIKDARDVFEKADATAYDTRED